MEGVGTVTYMKYCYFFLLFVFSSQVLPAQTLIPFLGKNGKYGFANERGEVLIQPNFEGYLPFWPAKFLSINSRQKDQPVSLLRNGMAIPGGEPYGHSGRQLWEQLGNMKKPDTLHHLVLLKNEKKNGCFADLNTRQTNVFPFIENYQNPKLVFARRTELPFAGMCL